MGPESVHVFDRDSGLVNAFSTGLPKAIDSLRSEKPVLEIVLSDAYCRYCVTERPAGLRNCSELQAALRNRFRAIFGSVDSWLVGFEAAPFSQRDFVAGVDNQIVDSIYELADAAGMRVVSVVPHFVAWARALRSKIRRGHHWVVAADKHWLSLGYFQDGQCMQARTLRLNPEAVNLVDLLNREQALVFDVDLKAPVWFGGSTESVLPLAVTGMSIQWLPLDALWRQGGIRK